MTSLIKWPKYWSFSFSISPSSEYSGLISFRINCFDLLAVKGHSRVFSSPTVPKHQHDCRKNHSFDYTDLFGKVMSLLFNMLSRLVIAFLPRSKSLLIPWLQPPSAVTVGEAQSNPDRNWRTHILSLPGTRPWGKRETRIHSPAGQGSGGAAFWEKTADGSQQLQRAAKVGHESPSCSAAVYGVDTPSQTWSSS